MARRGAQYSDGHPMPCPVTTPRTAAAVCTVSRLAFLFWECVCLRTHHGRGGYWRLRRRRFACVKEGRPSCCCCGGPGPTPPLVFRLKSKNMSTPPVPTEAALDYEEKEQAVDTVLLRPEDPVPSRGKVGCETRGLPLIERAAVVDSTAGPRQFEDTRLPPAPEDAETEMYRWRNRHHRPG